MNINEYRRQWLRWRRIYERDSFTIMRKAFIKAIKQMDLTGVDEFNYKVLLPSRLPRDVIFQGYLDMYTYVGLKHGRRVLRDIRRQQQKDLFGDAFQRLITPFLRSFAGSRIISVGNTFADWIIEQIAVGLEKRLTIPEIVSEIVRRRSIYRWQLLRIVRTEVTAAAGYASDVASSQTGIVMEKVWVSATDPRTRRVPDDSFDHLEMNNVRVPDGQPFQVPNNMGGFELMRFPGDPNASAGNVINCRCSMIKVAKRDSDGNVISI